MPRKEIAEGLSGTRVRFLDHDASRVLNDDDAAHRNERSVGFEFREDMIASVIRVEARRCFKLDSDSSRRYAALWQTGDGLARTTPLSDAMRDVSSASCKTDEGSIPSSTPASSSSMARPTNRRRRTVKSSGRWET